MRSISRFKTLYLHIGLSKTGSTSIQRNIFERAALLESRYDIHFPVDLPGDPPFNGNHSKMLRALFSGHPEAQRRLPTIGIHSAAELRDYTAACRQRLERSFAASEAGSLLLSAESVCNFKPCDLASLSQWASSLADRVRVIACVRHPVHALSSEIQQRLRVGARLENLYRSPPYKRLRSLFEEMEKHFGRDHITAYSFHRALENPSGLTSEFFRQLGTETGDDFRSRREENTSISAEAALMLDALNQAVPQFRDGVANPERRQYSIQRLLGIPGPRYRVPGEVVEKARRASGDEVAWMEATYKLDLSHDETPASPEHQASFNDDALQMMACTISRIEEKPNAS